VQLQAEAGGKVQPEQNQQAGKQEPISDEAFSRRWAREMRKLERELGMPVSEAKTQLERLRAMQDSQKTEAQKLSESLAEAEKRALEAELRAAAIEADVLRARLARESGLPPEWVEDIKGITEDEIKASIASIKKRHGLDRVGGRVPSGGSASTNSDFNKMILEQVGRGR
jgi:DNA-binding transcriptional MerR regulator